MLKKLHLAFDHNRPTVRGELPNDSNSLIVPAWPHAPLTHVGWSQGWRPSTVVDIGSAPFVRCAEAGHQLSGLSTHFKGAFTIATAVRVRELKINLQMKTLRQFSLRQFAVGLMAVCSLDVHLMMPRVQCTNYLLAKN
jgi:hypothetical protein